MECTRGLDGVKLSHRNPPENVWTFASALVENYRIDQVSSLCPCINSSDSNIPAVPAEVGCSYSCDTGARNLLTRKTLHQTNPLWDGAGCEGKITCCFFNNPPWFYREVAESANDIEMNVCTDKNPGSEGFGLPVIELYAGLPSNLPKFLEIMNNK